MAKRKNIFQIINLQHDPTTELQRIDDLLHLSDGVYEQDEFLDLMNKGTPKSILAYVDQNLFKSWSQRGTCIDCNDFADTIGICSPKDYSDFDEMDVITYCEYAINLIYLLKMNVRSGDTLTDVVDAVETNIRIVLDYYNHEVKYYEDSEKALVVPKNAQATAVAEIVNDELAYSVVEYNHYLLKGDIEKKKAILLALGNDIEPKRQEISDIDKQLASDIFFMLNNLNIRHNNKKKGDAHYKEAVEKMRKNKLEQWYDELYQMILLAYLLLDNKQRAKEVKELKKLF